MKKLTAEKCRELIDDLKSHKAAGFRISSAREGYLAALEIALPILEQQDHDKSIIAGQLEAVRDSLTLTPHQDAIINCAIDRLNLLTSRTLELSRSLIKQQERGEGDWIEWCGGSRPIKYLDNVEIHLRSGNLRCGNAGDWSWQHTGSIADIIAYRIIPERATNQNGEQ